MVNDAFQSKFKVGLSNDAKLLKILAGQGSRGDPDFIFSNCLREVVTSQDANLDQVFVGGVESNNELTVSSFGNAV